MNIPTVSCAPNAPIVYVAADGSGDFNCGSSNVNVQINQALQYVVTHPEFTTVYLKGPATYVISDTLVMGNNTTLTGDPSATIKLSSKANWHVAKSMVQISSNQNIVLSGFSINGNREGNTNVHSGGNYYNILGITRSQNIDVNHMTLTNNHDDGIETHASTNMTYHDNTLYLLGHDGLYACDSSNIEAYNNNITCRTNSGLRAYNTNHVSFHDNTITAQGGGAGIEIQKAGNDTLMDDIEIYNNVIHNTVHAGIWIFGALSYPASSTYVHVHHNIIYDTGTTPQNGITGGILSDGFNGLIENNIIDGTYSSGIAQGNIYSTLPYGSGFVLTIRNNIVTNTKSGYGIENTLTKTHSFKLQNNCFYNNLPGNANGVSLSASDLVADPLFVNASNHDYHLQSISGHWNGNEWTNDSVTSPCIDAGYPQSDYSNEPQCNGNRINLGAYGNTIYESKSPAYNPIVPIFPDANFINNVSSGYVPLYVQFTDYSGNATNWSWDFGDGAISTNQNPVHVFTTAGTYDVILTASNINGTNSTSTQIVASARPVFPVAAFTASSTTGNAPLRVTFTDKSRGSPTSWSWDFGDGGTSTQKNAVHVFTTTGTYNVNLTASNGNGVSSTSAQIVVSAKPVLPVAAFTASSTTGIAPLTVSFTDKSTGSPNVWKWDFGDKSTSTVNNPTHTYSRAGKYTVTLTVTNSARSNKITKSNYIVVVNALKPPVAAFTAAPLSGKASLTVTFTDKSTNNPASWSWDFGDKSTSTDKNPVHKYTKAGKYTVSLTVKNAAGSNTKRISDYVTVRIK
jgi:PKD repeat protein